MLNLGPEHTGHFVQPHVAAHCGGDIYSRRKSLFSSFGEHTAVCGSSVRQAVARPRHRQSVCIHNIHVAATCRPSVLGSATKTRPLVAKQSGQCARALKRRDCSGNLSHNDFSDSESLRIFWSSKKFSCIVFQNLFCKHRLVVCVGFTSVPNCLALAMVHYFME